MTRQRVQKGALLQRIHAGDVFAFYWCMGRRHKRVLTRCSKVVSHSADGFYYPCLPVAVYLLGGNQASSMLLALTLGFLLERPLYTILKKGFKRNRPAQSIPDFSSAITPSDQFSFPSGHTSGAFLSATVTVALFPWLFWPMYLWASLVGASRILLGVHFPTDTLAGAVMGATIGGLTISWLL